MEESREVGNHTWLLHSLARSQFLIHEVVYIIREIVTVEMNRELPHRIMNIKYPLKCYKTAKFTTDAPHFTFPSSQQPHL